LRQADYHQYYGITSRVEQPAADWILLASIRNNENWFKRYWGAGQLAHRTDGTYSSTVKGWLQASGYTRFAGEDNWFFSKGLDNLQQASDLFHQGWHVILSVHSDMLSADKQHNHSWFPNHYVVLHSTVSFTDDATGGAWKDPDTGSDTPPGDWSLWNPRINVRFEVFTWGKIKTVPEDGRHPVNGVDVTRNYYGFLAANY
jgi:hypothetical protein